MTWVELVLPSFAFALVLGGPGWVIGRALGLRGLLGLGLAPALSSACYAVGSVVLARLGIDWSPLPVAAGVLAVAVAALGATRLAHRARPRTAPVVAARVWREQALWGLSWRAWLVWAVVVGSIIMIAPTVVGMGAPDAPLQQWDAVFHLNGVALIQETGAADNLNGLYGPDRSVYYPTVWHAMVALALDLGGPLTPSSIPAAANASTLVIASVGWLTGLAAFAQACFPRRPGIVVVTVAVASAFSMFPTVLLSTLAQWPNGLSVMLVPGAAAGVVTTVRAISGRTRLAGGGPVVLGFASLAALVGVGSAHGTGVLGVALVAGPFVVAVAVSAVVAAWRGPHRRRAVAGIVVGVVLAAGLVYAAGTSSVLAGLTNYDRLPQRIYVVSVPRTLLDWVVAPWPGSLVVTVAVVLGAVQTFRGQSGRWLVAATGMIVALSAIAAGPENPLRALTGMWYRQAARIEALYPITAAVLAALGIAVLSGWLRERWVARREAGAGTRGVWSTPALAALVVVVAFLTSAGFQAPHRAQRFAQAYDPSQIRWGTMLSVEELELMRELPDVVDADAVIIGDPFSGAPFAWSIGMRRVVFPQLNTSGRDEGSAYLLEHFREIGTDPKVCEFLDELAVTHFYQDSAGEAEGAKVNPGAPGLRDVDTSVGFTEVAVAGHATLFEIDLCGD